jgi:hypothetical protein
VAPDSYLADFEAMVLACDWDEIASCGIVAARSAPERSAKVITIWREKTP